MSDEATLDGGITEVDAVVIGSGFAGLYSIHRLRNESGITVQAFDNAGDVGGTWFWNQYPGARSDTEVNAYCYSFDKELFHDWKWTERYPRQQEILAYLNHVADRYDLRRSIRFDTQVETGLVGRRHQPVDRRDQRRHLAGAVPGRGGRPPVGDQDPALPRPGQLPRRHPPHRPLATGGAGPLRQAGRRHRHRLQRGPGDLRARRQGRPPQRLPAHPAVGGPGQAPSDRSRSARADRERLRGLLARRPLLGDRVRLQGERRRRPSRSRPRSGSRPSSTSTSRVAASSTCSPPSTTWP